MRGEVFEGRPSALLSHGHFSAQSEIFFFAAIMDLQRLGVVAGAVADFATHVHIGEEVHLDAFGALALAGFASGRPLTLKLKTGRPRSRGFLLRG